jgi:hypothetical protein
MVMSLLMLARMLVFRSLVICSTVLGIMVPGDVNAITQRCSPRDGTEKCLVPFDEFYLPVTIDALISRHAAGAVTGVPQPPSTAVRVTFR